MRYTLAALRSFLTSNLDTVSESTVFGHMFVVAFYAKKHDSRIVLHVKEEIPGERPACISIGSSSTASNDFLGTADAYTRAAAFVRALNLPIRD